MKRLALAAAAAASLAAVGGASWWWIRGGGGDGAALTPLGPTRIDFPPVVRGEPGELVQTHDFRFRSDLKTPLRVASVTASCPCTTATAQPSEVVPGGDLVVHTITTLEHAGGRHATVWVRFDDGRGIEMRLSAVLWRPVVLSTVPAYPRADEAADAVAFTLVWTGLPQASDPVAPEFEADRGEVTVEFGEWASKAVDPGAFGPDGPPEGVRAFAGSVRVRRLSERWPVILTVRSPGADPLPIQLRDLLAGE